MILSRRGTLVGLGAATLAGNAFGQAYPDRAIRFVGGFPPGGPADLSARMLAQSLGEILGQQVVVENKSGAAGNIASQMVAEAKPDGYTLLVGTSIMSIVPSVYDKLPYDPPQELRRRRPLHHHPDGHRRAGRRPQDPAGPDRAPEEGTGQDHTARPATAA